MNNTDLNEAAPYMYKLFKFFADEHNLILTGGEMDDIIHEVNQWQFEQKQDADNLSIDELLSEFKRQGFDISNWDGEEGAEKAIVDGVQEHIRQQLAKTTNSNE